MSHTFIYPKKPKWLKYCTKVLRILVYASTLVTGVSAIVLTPQTLESPLIFLSTDVWGPIVILGSVGCLIGAIRERFRWELSTIFFVIAGELIYFAAIVDSLVLTPTRTVQVSVVLTLILMLLIRLTELISAYQKTKTLFNIESSL